MNDLDVIEQLKSAVGPAPAPPPHRAEAIRHRARLVRHRRWSEAVGSAALVVAIVGAVVAVGGRPDGLGPVRQGDLLSQAEAQAAKARTARMSVSFATAGRGQPGTTEAEVDFRNGSIRSSDRKDTLIVGTSAYLSITAAEREQARGALDGKSWIRRELPPAGAVLIGELVRPQDLFEAFRESGKEPVEAGPTEVRGVRVTEYRFEPGPSLRGPAYPGSRISAFPSLFVDDDGLPRRLVVRYRIEGELAANAPGGAIETTYTMDFYDFGARVEGVRRPTSAEVVEEPAYFDALGSGEPYRRCGEIPDELVRRACRGGITTSVEAVG